MYSVYADGHTVCAARALRPACHAAAPSLYLPCFPLPGFYMYGWVALRLAAVSFDFGTGTGRLTRMCVLLRDLCPLPHCSYRCSVGRRGVAFPGVSVMFGATARGRLLRLPDYLYVLWDLGLAVAEN
jgi:hypothetical protein